MLRRPGLAALACLTAAHSAAAQQCDIKDVEQFGPPGPRQERIHLVDNGEGDGNANDVIVFRTSLRVNTDGAPTSYSPSDLTGSKTAINNICNGVSVRNAKGEKLGCASTRSVFAAFRDSGWREPAAYRIRWQNVIAPRRVGDRVVPCVFENGPHKGFFGSLTTLRNGLSGDAAGECLANDQVDHRTVPAMVLPGGDNALRRLGARIGDLVVVSNPENGVTLAAILADSGPPDNLGEGSVALNMALLGRTTQPTTYAEAKKLDTGTRQMIVAVIPRSAGFQRTRPFTAQNIQARAAAWLAARGYGTQSQFVQAIAACTPR